MYSKYSLQKSTEQRKIVAFQVRRIIYTSKIAEQGINFLARLLRSIMSVFGDDFATALFREELCYHRHPKKQIRRFKENETALLLQYAKKMYKKCIFNK